MYIIGDVHVTLTAAVKPTADSDTYLAIGVGVGAALLVVVITTVVLTWWCFVKKNRSKSGRYNIYMDKSEVMCILCIESVPSSCGAELKILG